jgi:hypothetical protein
MPDDTHTPSEKAYRLLMANLKGQAAPAICIYHIIGWVHIAAEKSVDYLLAKLRRSNYKGSGRILNPCEVMDAINRRISQGTRKNQSFLLDQQRLDSAMENASWLSQNLLADCRGLAQAKSPGSLHPSFIKYVEDVVSPHIIRLCLWSCLTNILDHLERAQQCSAPD